MLIVAQIKQKHKNYFDVYKYPYMKLILLVAFLMLTHCTTTAKQAESDATLPRLQGIANVLTCMFEPDSEECDRAKQLNNK